MGHKRGLTADNDEHARVLHDYFKEIEKLDEVLVAQKNVTETF